MSPSRILLGRETFHGRLFGIPRLRLGEESSATGVKSAKLPGSFLTLFLRPNFFASFFTRRLCSRIRFWMLYLRRELDTNPALSLDLFIHLAAGALPAQLLFLALSVALEQEEGNSNQFQISHCPGPASNFIFDSVARSHTQLLGRLEHNVTESTAFHPA